MTFVYGESLLIRGQSKNGLTTVCRAMRNCYGIPVCACFDLDVGQREFKDIEPMLDVHKAQIQDSIDEIPLDKPIYVFPGIGKDDGAGMPDKLRRFMLESLIKLPNLMNKGELVSQL